MKKRKGRQESSVEGSILSHCTLPHNTNKETEKGKCRRIKKMKEGKLCSEFNTCHYFYLFYFLTVEETVKEQKIQRQTVKKKHYTLVPLKSLEEWSKDRSGQEEGKS